MRHSEKAHCAWKGTASGKETYDEQPWRYIVATKNGPPEFQKLLSCLIEGNQVWAKAAPVLALGVASLRFALKTKENRAAVHDLGLAAGSLLVEATARGPISPSDDRNTARESDARCTESLMDLKLGQRLRLQRGPPANLPDRVRERELAARKRKPFA